MGGARARTAIAVAIVGSLVSVTVLGVQALPAWESTTTVTVGVQAGPCVFQLGDGASNSRYFKHVTLSTNGTSFTAEAKVRAGGDMVVADVIRLTNSGAVSENVILRGTEVTNARVEMFTWTVKDGATTVATLNLRESGPLASFTLPAGTTYGIDVRVKLAEGSGNHNAKEPFSIWMEVP